jgi:hypothetical protein
VASNDECEQAGSLRGFVMSAEQFQKSSKDGEEEILWEKSVLLYFSKAISIKSINT